MNAPLNALHDLKRGTPLTIRGIQTVSYTHLTLPTTPYV